MFPLFGSFPHYHTYYSPLSIFYTPSPSTLYITHPFHLSVVHPLPTLLPLPFPLLHPLPSYEHYAPLSIFYTTSPSIIHYAPFPFSILHPLPSYITPPFHFPYFISFQNTFIEITPLNSFFYTPSHCIIRYSPFSIFLYYIPVHHTLTPPFPFSILLFHHTFTEQLFSILHPLPSYNTAPFHFLYSIAFLHSLLPSFHFKFKRTLRILNKPPCLKHLSVLIIGGKPANHGPAHYFHV